VARNLILVGFVLALAGCGTTTKDGGIGDTLDSRTLHLTVHKFAERPKAQRVAVNVELCRDEDGPAVNAYAFTLEFDGGPTIQPTRPQTVFDDEFEANREGCERGWIEYTPPAGGSAEALHFSYDDTGSAAPGNRREEHVDFTWKL
jgi:hypothetical protein